MSTSHPNDFGNDRKIRFEDEQAVKYLSNRHLTQLAVATMLVTTACGCSALRSWHSELRDRDRSALATPRTPTEDTDKNLFPGDQENSLKPTIRGQNDDSGTSSYAPAYAPRNAPSYAPANAPYPPATSPAYSAPGNPTYRNGNNSGAYGRPAPPNSQPAAGNYGFRNNGRGYNPPPNAQGPPNGASSAPPNASRGYGNSNSYRQPTRPRQPTTSYQPGTAFQPGTAYQPTTSFQPGRAPSGPPAGSNQGVLPQGSATLGPAPSAPITGVPGDFLPAQDGSMMGPNFADIDAFVEEGRTGRLMFGVGVNSNAGVTGQIVVDERNFDIWRPPTSWDDVASGRAWRGAGQGFRAEAAPGTRFQRYLISFTEPYLFDTPVSMSVSGFYYNRRYFDWSEQRLGGRLALGYRLTHDLSVSLGMRGEQVTIFNPRVSGVPELDNVVGDNALYIPQLTIRHDTRDVPFFPTQGHLVELGFQQGFGDFDYSKVDIDLRRYFMLRQRADGSGRHTLALGTQIGFAGADTPIFENYFAGGFSTLRGFAFRGASPVDQTVVVGGRFQFIGSAEYFFPLTADDMLKGVVFCDFGTVERNIEINKENFRVAPGFGLRVNIPALGPAPLAFDFGFPVAKADTDRTQVFSFFLGIGR